MLFMSAASGCNFYKRCIQCPWSPGHWKSCACSPRMSECATGTPATSIKYSIINFHPKRLSTLQAEPQSELCLYISHWQNLVNCNERQA